MIDQSGVIKKWIEKILVEEKGLTLIETIIALAIVGMTMVLFITFFSSNVINTFSFGNKNNAMAIAADKMELLYAIEGENFLTVNIQEKLSLGSSIPVEYSNTISNLYNSSSMDLIRFHVERVNLSPNGHIPIHDGYKVTLVVFYGNGRRYVTLASYFKGGALK